MLNRAERRAAEARARAEAKAEREARRKAKQHKAEEERRAAVEPPPAASAAESGYEFETLRRRDGSASFSISGGPPGSRMRVGFAKRTRETDPYLAWLDERDARVPLTRADLHSANDQ